MVRHIGMMINVLPKPLQVIKSLLRFWPKVHSPKEVSKIQNWKEKKIIQNSFCFNDKLVMLKCVAFQWLLSELNKGNMSCDYINIRNVKYK